MIHKKFIAAVFLLAPFFISSSANAQSVKAPKKNHQSPAKPLSAASQARTDLLKATQEYKASLQKLIELYEKNVTDANARLAKQQELFAAGIISKHEMEDSQQKVAAAQLQITQAKKQLAEADDLIAEASLEEAPATSPRVKIPGYVSTSAYLRFTGSAHWALADAAKVSAFFQERFGHALPVSAYGQTATHDRLGFDHRNALDVAVHPDSAEGQALIHYLQSVGIPFLAFRRAISGSATGAHIHIGYPSHRISAVDLSR
ncbi:MAG: TolC family protein [Acidobacteria bacterium]|nr:TolC family protein [Acidobacteriota bacterium]